MQLHKIAIDREGLAWARRHGSPTKNAGHWASIVSAGEPMDMARILKLADDLGLKGYDFVSVLANEQPQVLFSGTCAAAAESTVGYPAATVAVSLMTCTSSGRSHHRGRSSLSRCVSA